MREPKLWEELSQWQRENDARLNKLADYVVDSMDMDDLISYAKERLMGHWATAQEQFEVEYKEMNTFDHLSDEEGSW